MNYVGIDLGTTNSAIGSYDGETVRLYKSPEQHDVTPSAIFIDKRGSRYVGERAYNNAARNADSAAVLFKRLMGSNTPIALPAVNLQLTPEECSAEILRTLFGYLPEEIRNSQDCGTVITVPAAFNQMQKDATLTAAEAAHIGQVALMQEPVAAVMTAMRTRRSDGAFLIFDLGGGTLDIAIAQGTAGRVSLMAHGGIAMCGGRDFDRAIFRGVIKPWLLSNFKLPEDFDDPSASRDFRKLASLAAWATERGKIELSGRDEVVVSLPETELGVRDLAGADIYVDVPVTRKQFDELIEPKLTDAVEAARTALTKAGLGPNDVERIVFVGGPTQYKPLRDKIASRLGIAPSTDVNPMTAVAEGAAVFAESIDWTSQSRGRKSARGAVSTQGPLPVTLNFLARTPDSRARIVVKLGGTLLPGTEFQIDSLDTGWSSGRVALSDGASVDVTLAKPGDNAFKIFVFDSAGGPIRLGDTKFVITRTAASVDAIPASQSVGIEVREKLGGRVTLAYLVRDGDQLPKKGTIAFRAEESLKAGSSGALNFKLWEGEIADPITDNRFIGLLAVRGSDFETGVIAAGAEVILEYEVRDSGSISLEVSVPSISGTFGHERNFYSRQEGQIDYSKASAFIQAQAKQATEKLQEIASNVEDGRLEQARSRLEEASLRPGETDPEAAKQALDNVQEARRLMAETRKAHLKVIRQVELDRTVGVFDDHVRQFARPAEAASFDNLVKTSQRDIDKESRDFEAHLEELRGKNFSILWRQDWFVIDRFNRFAEEGHLFADIQQHQALVEHGTEALNAGDIDRLRSIVAQMHLGMIGTEGDDDMLAGANIVLG